MQKVITVLKTTIKIQEGQLQERTMMLANKDNVVFKKQLPQVDEEYLAQCKQALQVLEWFTTPLEDWCNVIDEKIAVPDRLDSLLNTVGMQIGFYEHSGVPLNQAICRIVRNAEKFFHEQIPAIK